MTTRAIKGGQYGANGEWYEGGKFLNTIPENRKKEGSAPKGKIRKCQVAPYVWEMQPTIESYAIFGLVGSMAEYVDRYASDLKIQPNAAGVAYYGNTFRGYSVEVLCEMWNNGQRWI